MALRPLGRKAFGITVDALIRRGDGPSGPVRKLRKGAQQREQSVYGGLAR